MQLQLKEWFRSPTSIVSSHQEKDNQHIPSSPKKDNSLRFLKHGLEMTALTTDNKEVGNGGKRQGKWPLFIMSSVTAFLASSSPTYKLVIHPHYSQTSSSSIKAILPSKGLEIYPQG